MDSTFPGSWTPRGCRQNNSKSNNKGASIFVVMCALILMAPLSAGAIEVNGTVTVMIEGEEILPDTTAPVPLKNVTVHLGLLEAPTLYTYLDTDWSTQTDENGEYTIMVADDDPPVIPSLTIPYVLTIILESGDSVVAVYDKERDSDNAACLSTPSFDVANRGVTRVDIQLKVRTDNDGSYSFQGMDFRPDEDREMVFGGTTRCTEDVLASPVALGVLLSYDPKGMTNSRAERFAHLAVHYARIYNAYEFVRDGLGKTGFSPVRVNGWDSFPDVAYDCNDSAILLDAGNSTVAGPAAASALFDLRHEYGHHYMCVTPIAGFGLPNIPPGDQPHGNLANDSSSDSWVEGFASYFAAAVAQHHGEKDPQRLRTLVGFIDLRLDGASLDDPAMAAQQLTYGEFVEEFAIASLLWQLSDTTGQKPLLDALETPAVDFYQVYTDLGGEPSVAALFDRVNCIFPQTTTALSGLDCLFISRGFYHDLNGDGFYGNGENVGQTRWELSARGPSVFRSNLPPLKGTMLRLSAVDESAQPIAVGSFTVEIHYDPPLEQQSVTYTQPASGSGPWEFGILIPAVPSRAIITPLVADYVASAPLVIESEFFHDRINPYYDGGVQPVPPIFAEHTFVLRSDSAEGPFGDPTCADMLDNDDDGLTDEDDPDCLPVAPPDMDGDGVPDGTDNCPTVFNPDQADAFPNTPEGDACETDVDLDGIANFADNCPDVPNANQADNDGDGIGDVCDSDDDDDGLSDDIDNCPLRANPTQSDFDRDGVGDTCDGDADGDGVANALDGCPLSPGGSPVNTDGCTGAQFITLSCEPGDFRHHGQFVSCVAHAANEAVAGGLISPQDKGSFVKDAARSRK